MINDPEKLIEFVEENGEMLTNEFQIKILNLKKSAAVRDQVAPAHNIRIAEIDLIDLFERWLKVIEALDVKKEVNPFLIKETQEVLEQLRNV